MRGGVTFHETTVTVNFFLNTVLKTYVKINTS